MKSPTLFPDLNGPEALEKWLRLTRLQGVVGGVADIVITIFCNFVFVMKTIAPSVSLGVSGPIIVVLLYLRANTIFQKN
jgi:hypothetical protein